MISKRMLMSGTAAVLLTAATMTGAMAQSRHNTGINEGNSGVSASQSGNVRANVRTNANSRASVGNRAGIGAQTSSNLRAQGNSNLRAQGNSNLRAQGTLGGSAKMNRSQVVTGTSRNRTELRESHNFGARRDFGTRRDSRTAFLNRSDRDRDFRHGDRFSRSAFLNRSDRDRDFGRGDRLNRTAFLGRSGQDRFYDTTRGPSRFGRFDRDDWRFRRGWRNFGGVGFGFGPSYAYDVDYGTGPFYDYAPGYADYSPGVTVGTGVYDYSPGVSVGWRPGGCTCSGW